ncbi:hypothetical protein Drorol1_Dr00024377 [Drosera rotundifolia]
MSSDQCCFKIGAAPPFSEQGFEDVESGGGEKRKRRVWSAAERRREEGGEEKAEAEEKFVRAGEEETEEKEMGDVMAEKAAKKAARLVTEMKEEEGFVGLEIEECGSLDKEVRVGDIVSYDTNSEVGLVKGVVLKEGVHLDLAGELVGAVVRDVVGRESVGTLVELIEGEKKGKVDEKEITVFKSVESGVVDVLATQLAYESHMKGVTKENHDDDHGSFC